MLSLRGRGGRRETVPEDLKQLGWRPEFKAGPAGMHRDHADFLMRTAAVRALLRAAFQGPMFQAVPFHSQVWRVDVPDLATVPKTTRAPSAGSYAVAAPARGPGPEDGSKRRCSLVRFW